MNSHISEVFLILGSNKGDKRQYLEDSLALIAQHMEVVQTSSYYESQAWGMKSTSSFWNKIVVLKTSNSPIKLLESVINIEFCLGRRLKSLLGSYQDREIDIDILFYDQMVFEAARLSIPHPLLHLRRFVLEPLCELAPQKLHPTFGLTLTDLLRQCSDPLEVKKIG